MKSLHYWMVHRRVFNRVWRNLDGRVRDTISADAEHTTRDFKEFNTYVNSETERLYNDPTYFYNDPYSFKYES